MTAVEGQERLDALPPGAALRDYTIEDVLGHGGFGIVYRARHNELGNVVAVKEYLPVELAVRDGVAVRVRGTESREAYEDGLLRFRDEARALIEFQAHPSIVSCREFFRANGTAYLVMEHEEGLPLSELLRRREASGRPFDEADLLQVMIPLLEGLARVHEAGMLHRDIKPSNILVRRSDERPVLIDFGAAKQGFAERSKSLAPHTEGYAAPEQVGAGKLGPWTDVYAAGAVMWRIAAGGNPPKVENRAFAALRGEADPMPSARELGAERFSPGVLNAIDRCLKLNEKERIRGCGELLGLLRGAGAEPAAETVGRQPVRKRREEPAATAAPQADLSKVVARITFLLLTYVSMAAAQAGRSKGLWGILAPAGVILAAGYALAVWTAERASRETEAVFTAPQNAGGSLEDAALARAEAQWEAVRDRRDAAAARAYIEEYGGIEGAGVWVSLAESLVEELDNQAKERAVSTVPQDAGGSLEDAALARAEAQWEAVRDKRDAAAARAYIKEYGGVDGAGVWVRLAESLVEELDSQAKERAAADAARRRKAEEARATWERVKGMQSESVLTAYITRWEREAEAAAFVDEARDLLDDLAKIRKAKKEMAVRAEAWEAWEKVKGTQSESVLTAYIAQWKRKAEAREFVDEARVRLDALARVRIAYEVAEELKRRGSRFLDCSECPQMVVIPAGSFLMGSPESEEGRFDNEGPQHRVTIPAPFAVGAYEVTFEEWDACVAEGGCGGYRPNDNGWGRGWRPVIHVSWNDAQAYVRWLRGKTGKEYRLLSEAEWEYAARAGTTTRYSFGDEITESDANYDVNIGKTQPVGSYRANAYGLYDMHGNVWEWGQDCWNGSYAGAPNNGEAWERGDCSFRVLRGGSWGSDSRDLRSANRGRDRTGSRGGNIGFRVARTLTP